MAARKPVKLFKIGEVMGFSGLSRQTVHNYTMLGLIKPARRTKSGHRMYGEEVFDTLEKIRQLKRDHTLLQIKEILDAQQREGRTTNRDVEESGHGRGQDPDR